jgi:hypothetical protein
LVPQSLIEQRLVAGPSPARAWLRTRPDPLPARIPVWADGDVKVTAHLGRPPSDRALVGIRFDTGWFGHRSGDTTVSQNLINLAQGTDYLVHEFIAPQWVERLVATLPPEQQAPVRTHLLEAHTTIEQVGVTWPNGPESRISC